ncbi:MAG TPA: YigZ family protein [Geopsychrobacteraceae bacterium]|nr:YigZ family protein [Geopsychrobacteraceae bacterium]
MNNLQTIDSCFETTFEIKKSLLIAHIMPISIFQKKMESLKEKHKKARHFVWATRQLNEHQQIVENCTDDGEPRNTSGKPTLKVLQGHKIINAGIITVRYFGGIKLGTGGLVRAYNDAAQDAVQQARLIPLDNLYRKTIRVAYQQIHHAEYLLKQQTIKILAKNFAATHIDLTLQGRQERIEGVIKQIVTINIPKPE